MKKITTIALLFVSSFAISQVITIQKTAFVIHFDTVMKVPVYNYYEFTAKNRKAAQVVKRSPSFHAEEKILKRLQGADHDYKRPYDKGHYVPNDDMRFSALVESENMTYANVAPQWSTFNEIQWRLIENYVRSLGEKYDTLKIFTGGIFGSKYNIVGPDGIAIPDHYFKTVVIKNKGKVIAGIGFLSRNNPQNTKDISTYAVSIDSIEKILKVDLYPGNNLFELEKTLIK
jgi:endonuclease G